MFLWLLFVLFHLVQVRITTSAYAVGAYRRKFVCGPRSMSMGLAMTLQRSGLQCQPAHPKPSQLLLPITPQCGAVTLREFRISHSLFRICNTSLNAGSKDDQVPSRAELGMPHSMLRCGVLLHDAAETSKICQGPCEVRSGTTGDAVADTIHCDNEVALLVSPLRAWGRFWPLLSV